MARLAEPPHFVPPPPTRLAAAQFPRSSRHGGFRLIPGAYADTLPVRTGGPVTGAWAIQVGAFSTPGQARAAASAARGQGGAYLVRATAMVGTVHQGRAALYRARLTGLSRDAAVQACERISRHGCIVLSPNAQS